MSGFDHSPRTADLLVRLRAFMDEHIYPNEKTYHHQLNEVGRWATAPIIPDTAVSKNTGATAS